MDASDPILALRARLAELADLNHASSILGWDQQTYMPERGAMARGNAAGTIDRLAHERTADPAFGAAIDAAEAAGEDPGLIRAVREDHQHAVRVPASLVSAMTEAAVAAQPVWAAARQRNDFRPYIRVLREHVENCRAYAACFPDVDHPYDALLQRFEPGFTTAMVRDAFSTLQEGLVPLIAAIAARPDPGDLTGVFPTAEQRTLALEMARSMGFDESAWRLDDAVHPFMTSGGREDIRITTREDESSLAMGIFGVLHEAGHGMYEHQVDPQWDRTTVGTGTSLGVHESQSRLWENMVGRSHGFWSHWYPRAQELFPALKHVPIDRFLARINAVRPSLIRVDADEATYCLHIVLRFELEVALIEGTLEVEDVPEAWDRRMRELLGVEVPGPAMGVLQDPHWAWGEFGYFPTYALGTIIAGQLWQAAGEQLEDRDGSIAAGDLTPLREWLRENVHRHGRTRTADEILHDVTGGGLDSAPLLAYLREKYGALYGL